MRMVVVKMNEDEGYGRDERTVMSKTSERNFQFFFFENREILCECVRVSVFRKKVENSMFVHIRKFKYVSLEPHMYVYVVFGKIYSFFSVLFIFFYNFRFQAFLR